MRDLLKRILRHREAPDAPPRQDAQALANAKQEARSTRLRKELLAREVRATLVRLQK